MRRSESEAFGTHRKGTAMRRRQSSKPVLSRMWPGDEVGYLHIQKDGAIWKEGDAEHIEMKSREMEALPSFSNEKPGLRPEAYKVNNINDNNNKD